MVSHKRNLIYHQKDHGGLFPKATPHRRESNPHSEQGSGLGSDQHIDEKGRCVLNKIKVRYKCLSILLLLELHIMQALKKILLEACHGYLSNLMGKKERI